MQASSANINRAGRKAARCAATDDSGSVGESVSVDSVVVVRLIALGSIQVRHGAVKLLRMLVGCGRTWTTCYPIHIRPRLSASNPAVRPPCAHSALDHKQRPWTRD